MVAKSREELLVELREQFPHLSQETVATTIPGGRQAALARLPGIQPVAYERSRNYLDGAVTHLSPYIRHGVLSLAEVRDAAIAHATKPEQARKFLAELAWRDYYQRVYEQRGEAIWHDFEPYKTGYQPHHYADDLPADIPNAQSGLACMDAFARQLHATGYLHNHARMWIAAYVVHWRRVKWQAGAKWFLQHLLDGDPASNNLSWQWVASTFSNKPYFFNRENLERYTHGRYCQTCPLRGRCDFEGAYPALERRLFPLRKEPTP